MPRVALTIDFDGRSVEIGADSDAAGNVQLAYATSIHKVQGSEFPCAVVVAHKSHSFMHHRNLLYTAVTRAKESVILLGDRWGIENCASKRQVDRRNTFLSFLLHPGLIRSPKPCGKDRRTKGQTMPRFIDHLLAEKKWHVNWMGLPPWMFAGGEDLVQRVVTTRRVLHESNVVLIDNVAEYYFSHHVNANRGPDGPEQFPQLAPPFPMAFYEYTLLPWMYDTLFIEARIGKPRALNQVGVLVSALETGDIHVEASQHGPLFSVLHEHKSGLPPKWCLGIELFVGDRADRLAWCPALRLGFTVDADGMLASDPRYGIWAT